MKKRLLFLFTSGFCATPYRKYIVLTLCICGKIRYLFPLLLFFIFIFCKPTSVSAFSSENSLFLPVVFNESNGRADEARKRAIDFESPAYFPSEWEEVEAQYADVYNMSKSTGNEIQHADALSNIADIYDDIFRRTIPLYTQAVEDEIMFARDELIQTGFTNFFPKYLRNSDKTAILAMKQYEAKDYYKARNTAADALNDYRILFIGAKAFLVRQEIINRGFSLNNSDNFVKADEAAQRAIYEYEAGNKEAAKANAEEALFRYNLLLN